MKERRSNMGRTHNAERQQNAQQQQAKNASEFAQEFFEGPENNQTLDKQRKQQRKRRNEPKAAKQSNS
jgi:hypothetical protein